LGRPLTCGVQLRRARFMAFLKQYRLAQAAAGWTAAARVVPRRPDDLGSSAPTEPGGVRISAPPPAGQTRPSARTTSPRTRAIRTAAMQAKKLVRVDRASAVSP